MKIKLLFLLIILVLPPTTEGKEPTRVACIGNSITYGYGLKNRSEECYPAVLGIMLGENYTVENFGISARTLLNKGDHPYMQEKLFTEARAFHPDIVIIKLGTNDTKPHNWKYGKEFRKDLSALIDSFRCEGNPRIYLCYPATVYGTKWVSTTARLFTALFRLSKKQREGKK